MAANANGTYDLKQFPIGTIEEEGKALPIGGQLMGKWFDEENLLAAAHAFEMQSQ